MRLAHDQRPNLPIFDSEKHAEVGALRLRDDMVIDIPSDGTVFGIKLLNADGRRTNAQAKYP
jgi:uncharacterized protein YuzE